MQVQCILCEKVETIDEKSFQAKRLVNRRIGTYLCSTCDQRIAEKTQARHDSGKFKLYQPQENNKDSR